MLIEIIKRGYNRVFSENWPMWLGGILIGVMSIITFAWARPWGVAGGLRNWGDSLFAFLGVYHHSPLSPLLSTNSVLTLGLLWGSFGSALMSKQFAIRTAPPLELFKGVFGGILMGTGAAMAGGCNVGGFYSAISALSLGGVSMMIGLIIGAYLGLRYLYWELEHFPPKAVGSSPTGERKRLVNWLELEPYFGGVVLIVSVIAAWIYSSQALTRVGVLLLCGVAFGIIIQRTRFCFVRGFRDPFMTGEGEVARAISISLIISILGFAALKWTGLRGEYAYVQKVFWFGSLVGGIIFGIGMVIAGGCGSGSVWRAGEGQVKLILAVIFFAMSTSLVKNWIKKSESLAKLMGQRVFLPDHMGYGWSLIFLIALLAIYYLLATWNEETDKFVVEL